jgi:hypothetical protein
MSEDIEQWRNEFFSLNPTTDDETVSLGKKENTLSLSSELNAMDLCDREFYSNLSDVHKKEISLWVLMRYMSSSANSAERHLLYVNSFVNYNFSVLNKHPELQWKLLTVCGTRKKQMHQWIPPHKKTKKNRLEELLYTMFPLMKRDEVELLLQINTAEDLTAFLKENAMDDKAIKDILKGNVGA